MSKAPSIADPPHKELNMPGVGPKATTSGRTDTAAPAYKRPGWVDPEGFRTTKNFAAKYEFTGEKKVIHFLERDMVDRYAMHFVRDFPGRKGWRCLSRAYDPQPCPLCDIADKARDSFCFNIADLADPATPRVVVMEARKKLKEKIEGFAKDERLGPLDNEKLYFATWKTGEKLETEYHLERIPVSELEEYWGITPLTSAQLAQLTEQCFEGHVESVPNPEEMEKVVDYILHGEK